MTKKIFYVMCLLFITGKLANSQVKIGDNPSTINSNSILELESTSKGFLIPRVTLTGVSIVAPLSDPIPEGMIVYNSGSTLSKGFYYWDGLKWVKILTGASTPTSKTASATLTKNETFVLVNPSSTSATITLPEVTSIDNGLEITIKNIGSYDDLVTVDGYGSATIDGQSQYNETRYVGMTFIANGGNWITKRKENIPDNIMDVNAEGSWTTISEAIAFLEKHMSQPMIIRLGDEEYVIDETIIVELPYSLTIHGLSYSTSSIVPDTIALSGKPMFRCKTDCYFKMIDFNDGGGSGDHGSSAGEDAIRFLGEDTYNEIKDCTFDGFYNTVTDSSNAELWVFETDIQNATLNGILLHSATAGAVLKVAETDFIDCAHGVNLDKGSSATIQLASGGYYNGSGDSAITYHPYTFSFSNLAITGNSWNNVGSYISGFDFTRTNGRDKNATLESNAGMADQKPNCIINVLDNISTTTTLTTINNYYKVNWGSNTSSETCKWTINDNRITYQPENKRNVIIFVSGNLSVNASNQNINVCIVKNGNTANKYGTTTLRIVTSNQPFQFSFIAYIENVSQNDYFEIFSSNTSASGYSIKMQDLQWFSNTQ